MCTTLRSGQARLLSWAKQQRTLLWSFTPRPLTRGARGPWDRGHVPTGRLSEISWQTVTEGIQALEGT